MSIRPERCEATLRFEQRIVRCADLSAYCNEPGAPGLNSEREAELTLVWEAAS